MKEFFTKAYAWLKQRVDDIIQLLLAGGTTAAVAPMVVDDVTAATAGVAGLAGRLMAYLKLGLSK